MEASLSKLQCLYCNNYFSGNDNKKFCSDKCKNAFNNARRKAENKEIGTIINTLKTNRRIIIELLNGQKIKTVSAQRLLDKKFVFRFHTHTRINKGDGTEYVFCFDYGYLPLKSGWYKIVKAFKED